MSSLLDRRRMMMSSKKKDLVCHLVCEDYSGTGSWFDRANGLEFVPNNGNTQKASDGGVLFDGSLYFVANKGLGLNYRDSTLEVVFKNTATGNMGVFICGGNGHFCCTTTARVWATAPALNASHNVPYNKTNSLATLSTRYDHIFVNGVEISYTVGNFQGTTPEARIGYYSRGNFKGEIYEIRVYNHKLELDEIVAHQQKDMDKYG